MQPPPHSMVPGPHEGVQTPDEHTFPDVHAVPALLPCPASTNPPSRTPLLTQFPDAPQYWRSVLGLMQSEPHKICPGKHDGAQTPSAQTLPLTHVVPAFAPAQSPVAPQ